jgi:threo-3-hydroxy-L-aspartate ammonia-lyase
VKIAVPKTIADGLQTTSPSELTFGIAREHGCTIVTVTDAELSEAVAFAFERMKLVVEPSGAAAIAALLQHRIPGVEGKRIGLIISGGNADPSRYSVILSEVEGRNAGR